MPFFILLLILISFLHAYAEDRTHQGQITTEVRQFSDDDNEETFENQRALYIDYKTKKREGKLFTIFSIAGRYDDQDPARNILWPENIYAQYRWTQNLTIAGGTQIFSYSYLEAFNPLDQFNARIIDISIVSAEKIGEPYVGLEYYIGEGDLKIYLLPYAVAPVLPGKDSRLNLDKDFNSTGWYGQEGEQSAATSNFLISYEKAFESSDLGVVLSKNYDRSRILVGTDDYYFLGNQAIPNTTDLYTPYYYQRYLSGLNYVYNFSSFQAKFSASHSYYLAEDEIYTPDGLGNPKDYTTAASGIEKTFEHGTGHSSTLFLEYQKVFRNEFDEDNFITDNDFFLAYRYNLNDIHSSIFTFSFMNDLAKPLEMEGYFQLEFERRITNSWKVETGIIDYYIPDDAALTGIGLFEDKEHFFVDLSRYF
ncbi:MAG: hypothetical protein CME62_09635 [Halobacteriovoraceae bacterium]|nr:hypothetical protein [Halobacteriovoraceae bacterium]|tara:strand:- start:2143 stop:3408 length:1266 start_codon:yes stop_codon:yes gene_type:complete